MLLKICAVFFFFASTSFAQFKWGKKLFVDTYYAYDFNQAKEREYTTQPIKHNNPSINLAHIGLTAETNHLRSVLTLQYGTSVDRNYVIAPSNDPGTKILQEAYVGIKVGEDMWLDGGIYLGHIGYESWISSENWNYSRSLMLDYVPYYSAGLRLTSKHRKGEWDLHLMQGWQNISENNHGKAFGGQYTYDFSGGTFMYNNFIGHEPFLGQRTSGLRTYQNFVWTPKEQHGFRFCADIGTQNKPGAHQAYLWWNVGTQYRTRYSEKFSQSYRVEYFVDKKGVISPTSTKNGFHVWGASTNLDYQFNVHFLARFEVRQLKSIDAIYPTKKSGPLKRTDPFVVASLAYTY